MATGMNGETRPKTGAQMGLRILIVEDEPIVALDLENILSDAGYSVAGIAPSIDKAMSLVDSEAIDAAILDRNLRGENVEPVALRLHERGTPFLFVTGYDDGALKIDAPVLQKPVRPETLLEALKSLTTARAGGGRARNGQGQNLH